MATRDPIVLCIEADRLAGGGEAFRLTDADDNRFLVFTRGEAPAGLRERALGQTREQLREWLRQQPFPSARVNSVGLDWVKKAQSLSVGQSTVVLLGAESVPSWLDAFVRHTEPAVAERLLAIAAVRVNADAFSRAASSPERGAAAESDERRPWSVRWPRRIPFAAAGAILVAAGFFGGLLAATHGRGSGPATIEVARDLREPRGGGRNEASPAKVEAASLPAPDPARFCAVLDKDAPQLAHICLAAAKRPKLLEQLQPLVKAHGEEKGDTPIDAKKWFPAVRNAVVRYVVLEATSLKADEHGTIQLEATQKVWVPRERRVLEPWAEKEFALRSKEQEAFVAQLVPAFEWKGKGKLPAVSELLPPARGVEAK
jgi:hypothetical protein